MRLAFPRLVTKHAMPIPVGAEATITFPGIAQLNEHSYLDSPSAQHFLD
jgi:hypothetical protein